MEDPEDPIRVETQNLATDGIKVLGAKGPRLGTLDT